MDSEAQDKRAHDIYEQSFYGQVDRMQFLEVFIYEISSWGTDSCTE